MTTTYWRLSENDWEYYGSIYIRSENKPVVSYCEDNNAYKMEVDGVIIYFDEEIVEDYT